MSFIISCSLRKKQESAKLASDGIPRRPGVEMTQTNMDQLHNYGRRLTLLESVNYKNQLSWKILLTTSFLYLVPSFQFTLFAYYQFW